MIDKLIIKSEYPNHNKCQKYIFDKNKNLNWGGLLKQKDRNLKDFDEKEIYFFIGNDNKLWWHDSITEYIRINNLNKSFNTPIKLFKQIIREDKLKKILNVKSDKKDIENKTNK